MQMPWGRSGLLCWRPRNVAREAGERERKEGRKGPRAAAGPLSASPGFYSWKVCAKPDFHFGKTTLATAGREKKKKRHLLQLITVAESKGQKTMAWTRVGTVEVTRSGQILGI